MAWEISHTAEAWECFRRGLEAQTEQWLREACATCMADAKEGEDADWEEEFAKAMAELKGLYKDTLVDAAYCWCETNNTCSNGGFDFYVDEGGYYSICLSDYEEEEEE